MIDETYIKETRQMFENSKLPQKWHFHNCNPGKNDGERPKQWDAAFFGKDFPYFADVELLTEGICRIPVLLDEIEELQYCINKYEGTDEGPKVIDELTYQAVQKRIESGDGM